MISHEKPYTTANTDRKEMISHEKNYGMRHAFIELRIKDSSLHVYTLGTRVFPPTLGSRQKHFFFHDGRVILYFLLRNLM